MFQSVRPAAHALFLLLSACFWLPPRALTRGHHCPGDSGFHDRLRQPWNGRQSTRLICASSTMSNASNTNLATFIAERLNGIVSAKIGTALADTGYVSTIQLMGFMQGKLQTQPPDPAAITALATKLHTKDDTIPNDDTLKDTLTSLVFAIVNAQREPAPAAATPAVPDASAKAAAVKIN